MNLKMGNHLFSHVQIPLLWGKRAVIQDRNNLLSVIDLSEEKARLEILGDQPAPGIKFEPTFSGFKVLKGASPLYSYDPNEKRLESVSLDLPECQITPYEIRIGSSRFSGNSIIGSAVGLAVTSQGISLGAPLPPGLAELTI